MTSPERLAEIREAIRSSGLWGTVSRPAATPDDEFDAALARSAEGFIVDPATGEVVVMQGEDEVVRMTRYEWRDFLADGGFAR